MKKPRLSPGLSNPVRCVLATGEQALDERTVMADAEFDGLELQVGRFGPTPKEYL